MGFANHQALYLAGIVACLLCLGLIARLLIFKQSRIGRSAIWDIVWKSIALIIICLALADPYLEHSLNKNPGLVLVDISDSLDDQIGEQLLQSARTLSSQMSEVYLLPFAARPSNLALSIKDVGSYKDLKRSHHTLDIGHSDLERALRQGLNQTFGDESSPSRIILLSDGYETSGNVLSLLPSIQASKVSIYPLLPEERGQGQVDFRISQLYAPLLAPSQKSVEVRVSLKNASAAPQQGLLEVKHDSSVIFNKTVQVPPHSEALFIAASDPSQEGIKAITASLTPTSKEFQASSETVFLSGEKREKVLLISGNSEDERFLIPILQGQAYQLNAMRGGEAGVVGKIETISELRDYSAIIFNNVGIGQLPNGTAQKIEQYVAQGGGFVMIGGNRSFGLGGYINSPIEEVLPVELLPPRTEEKRLNVAVSLVLDKSKSMYSENKLEFAKEAAREVVRNLKDEDLVQIIGFDNVPFEVVQMGVIGNIRDLALERIGRLFPLGGTRPLQAMAEARRSLEGAKAGRKHMILLTDGKIPDAGPEYYEMVKQMRFVGVTVSTVMIGDEDDFGFLRNLAEFGGGAYYQTFDASNLPRIFLQDIKVRSGEKTLQESEEFPVRFGPDGRRTTDIDAYPPLRGFVETKSRNNTNLELVVISEGKAQPLFATWNYKQGKSAAFTSDANGRWSSYWANWGKFSRFWGDVIDSLRSEKGLSAQNIKFDLRQSVAHGSLLLDLSIFSDEGSSAVSATVRGPDGGTQNIEFKAISRGHYHAEIDQAKAGRYDFQGKVGMKSLTPVAFSLSGELFGEKKGQGFNVALLDQLAVASGGKFNPDPQVLQEGASHLFTRKNISHWFLALAALVLCFSILRREVGWSSAHQLHTLRHILQKNLRRK